MDLLWSSKYCVAHVVVRSQTLTVIDVDCTILTATGTAIVHIQQLKMRAVGSEYISSLGSLSISEMNRNAISYSSDWVYKRSESILP